MHALVATGALLALPLKRLRRRREGALATGLALLGGAPVKAVPGETLEEVKDWPVEAMDAMDGHGKWVAHDTFSHVKGNIENDATADVACDHFHRYKEDIQLVKNLGAKAYRFSISWSRVLPTGRVQGQLGEFLLGLRGLAMLVRPEAILHDELGAWIEPVATLYHWDLPEALERDGGWLVPETVEAFAEYAALCFERLGKFVPLGILGYCFGSHAPGRSVAPGEEPYLAGHHMLLAHARAQEVYRKVKPQGGQWPGSSGKLLLAQELKSGTSKK
eukprot:Skav201127  [mRNA]  locus=scaffold4373:134320:139263:+ [translate_table: standard]